MLRWHSIVNSDLMGIQKPRATASRRHLKLHKASATTMLNWCLIYQARVSILRLNTGKRLVVSTYKHSAYSSKIRWFDYWFQERINHTKCNFHADPSKEKFWSILVLWSITGLAAVHASPNKRSIQMKPFGCKFTFIQGEANTPHRFKCSWSTPKSGSAAATTGKLPNLGSNSIRRCTVQKRLYTARINVHLHLY